MDWLVRDDVVVLAAMLVTTVVISSRNVFSYYLSRRKRHAFVRDLHEMLDGAESEVIALATGNFVRDQKRSLSTVAVGLRTLGSISNTAPFVGLIGTCLGILDSFRGVAMEKHAAIAWMISTVALSLTTAAAGLLVATPATCAYNLLCGLHETSRRELFLAEIELTTCLRQWLNKHPGGPIRQLSHALSPQLSHAPKRRSILLSCLPLRGPVDELPGFAFMAGLFLTIAALAFTMNTYTYPKGLDIHAGTPQRRPRPGQIIVQLGIHGPRRDCGIYVNDRQVQSDEFGPMLLNALQGRAERNVYVTADDDCKWEDVATAIDIIRQTGGDVMLTSAPMRIERGRR